MGIKFKIAVCQIKISTGKASNLERARKMIAEASGRGAQIVVLPEMFNCPYDYTKFMSYAENPPQGPSLAMLAGTAKEKGIYLIGGSIPEWSGERIYNTSFVFSPAGELIARHRKVHLFDVDLSPGLRFSESKTIGFGDQVTVFDTAFGTMGVAICYDIRFPELIRLMALKGARVVFLPGAFNLITGPAHWEALLRVRAVDNQLYVVGASPARDDEASYVAYGHSLVADPWGTVVASAGEGEEVIEAVIDLDMVEKVRKELPLLTHRRTDLYEVMEKNGSEKR